MYVSWLISHGRAVSMNMCMSMLVFGLKAVPMRVSLFLFETLPASVTVSTCADRSEPMALEGTLHEGQTGVILGCTRQLK